MTNHKTMTNHKIGYAFSIGSALFYAIQIVIGKIILEAGVPAFDLLTIQYTTTSIILGLLVLLRKEPALFVLQKKHRLPLLLQGIIGCATTSILMYLAMERISAGIASMLLYLCPVFVCIFFMLSGLRKIKPSGKVAVAVSFVGAFLALDLFSQETFTLSAVGVILGLLSGITYAFYGLQADLKLREIKTETLLFYMYLVATMTIYIVNYDFFIYPPTIPNATILFLLGISAIMQVLPMGLLNLGIRIIGSDKASVIATIELPFTLIIAFLVLGETMHPVQILGVVFIVGAILILQYKKKEPSL